MPPPDWPIAEIVLFSIVTVPYIIYATADIGCIARDSAVFDRESAA